MKNVKIENGVVVGTSGDKYSSKNPVARYLINGFDNSIKANLCSVEAKNILEVGCGEGHITQIILNNTDADIVATDISRNIIEQVRGKILNHRVRFEVCRIEEIESKPHLDLVVCCEVIEHLTDPYLGLKKLASLDAEWYLLSVPREPIFRFMNMARGAYLSDFGNSPGHLNHWSRRGFIKFVSRFFEVVKVDSPLPWTVLLCRLK